MRSQHSPTSSARRAHNPVHISSAPEDKKNAPTDVSAIFLCKGYKKDFFGFLITGFDPYEFIRYQDSKNASMFCLIGDLCHLGIALTNEIVR